MSTPEPGYVRMWQVIDGERREHDFPSAGVPQHMRAGWLPVEDETAQAEPDGDPDPNDDDAAPAPAAAVETPKTSRPRRGDTTEEN